MKTTLPPLISIDGNGGNGGAGSDNGATGSGFDSSGTVTDVSGDIGLRDVVRTSEVTTAVFCDVTAGGDFSLVSRSANERKCTVWWGNP